MAVEDGEEAAVEVDVAALAQGADDVVMEGEDEDKGPQQEEAAEEEEADKGGKTGTPAPTLSWIR